MASTLLRGSGRVRLCHAETLDLPAFGLSPGRPTTCPSKSEGLEFSERLTHASAGYGAWSRPELRVDNLAKAFRDFTA